MSRSIVLLIGGLVSLSTVSLFAQDVVLGQKLSYGVHAYFAGDYLKAYEELTAAVDGGSKDPRVFYFRGLSYEKLGREVEAKQDFKHGADLESRDADKFYNVSKSLERVQGTSRVTLESFRINARMAVLEENERLHKLRYEAIQREEARVLRDMPPAPSESMTKQTAAEKPVEPAAKTNAEPAAADPFGAAEEKPAAKAEKKPSAKAAKDAGGDEDPFGGDAEKAEPAKPKAKAKKPAKEDSADESADKSDADPFADNAADKASDEKPAAKTKPAAKKGVKKDTSKKAASVKKPAKAEKADKAEGDDPFADTEKPAAKKPAKAEKKTDEKKADSDDPFAN
jgi:hypothetical protein